MKLEVRKKIDVPRAEVFHAWTDAESMREWMCPSTARSAEAELDVRVGGKFRIVMKSDTRDYEHTGEYRVVDPPSKLEFTWISEGTNGQTSLVTVEFLEDGAGTEVVLTHDGLPTEKAQGDHTRGWGQILDHLARVTAAQNKDFRLDLAYKAGPQRLYEQFATAQGVRNWWTVFCEMDETPGGRASFRFPSSGFYTVAEIAKLEPARCVEWLVLDQKHPEAMGFSNSQDWIGTRIRFDLSALDKDRSRLVFTHVGLRPLECAGVCQKHWAAYLDHSLRRYLETGQGNPHTK
jgi:uncharacterized protein YndB with AHSA1/START domain